MYVTGITAIVTSVAWQDGLTPVELAVIQSPMHVAAHRALMLTSDRLQIVLNLNEDQRANCAILKAKIRDDFENGRKRTAAKGRAWIKDGVFHLTFDENDEGVQELLNSEQMKRLGQIQLQALGPWAPFRLNCVASYLEITDDQKREAERLSSELSSEMSRLTSPKDGKSSSESISRFIARNTDKHLELLPESQREKLRELLGPPQDGTWILGIVERQQRRPTLHLESMLGFWLSPLRLLFCDQLLRYLEVTPRQRDQLIEMVDEERKVMQQRLKSSSWDFDDYTSRAKEILKQGNEDKEKHWKRIRGILDVKQIKRLNEAWLQVRELDELFSTTETAKHLGVSRSQHQEFKDFRKANPQVGVDTLQSKMREILKPEQRKKFEELKGEAIPHLLLVNLRATLSGMNCDEFGIPYYGISAR